MRGAGEAGVAGVNLAAPGRVSRVAVERKDPGAWPNGGRTWFAAVVSLVLAVNVMSSRYLFNDSFYDLYTGRYIVHHGIPHQNVFTSVNHGAGWMDQQWLAQVLYYGAWAGGGYRALAALSALLITSGFALLALLMLRRGVPPARAFAWTAAAAVVCLGTVVIRAQSFAYPFTVLTLWLILADARAPRLRRRTWLAVPVLVLWANTHGSVLLGAGLVVLYAGYRIVKALVGRDFRPIPGYVALGLVACASVACTPYGSGVVWYYSRFGGNPALTHNGEWVPSSPFYPATWGFFALVLAASIAGAVAWRRGTRPDPLLAGLTLVLLILAVARLRVQAWFAFGGSLLAAETLARSSIGRGPVLSKLFSRLTAGVLAMLALASVGTLAVTPASQFESLIPRRAIDVTAAIATRNPALRILGDDWSGSPMLWLHPAMFGRVGFDSRLEQYSSSELTAYMDFEAVRGPRWQRVLAGYGLIVMSRHQYPQLAAALDTLPGWQVLYQDRDGLVLARRSQTVPPA